MPVAKKEISLLPEEENPNALSAKIILWVTTVGRFIIVFTELIVISAFISRFWLDRKNADLSEVIRQREAILRSTQDFEKDYSLLQQRLKVIRTLKSVDYDYSAKIKALAESTPTDVIFQNANLSTSDKGVSAGLSVTASKEESIVNFITNLAVNPLVRSVNISRIEKKPKTSDYIVTLQVNFLPTAAKSQ